MMKPKLFEAHEFQLQLKYDDFVAFNKDDYKVLSFSSRYDDFQEIHELFVMYGDRKLVYKLDIQ